MRSLLLISATLFLLGGAFVLYWMLQPPTQAQLAGKNTVYVPPLRNTDSLNKIRPGTDAWFKEFDENTGEPLRMFRAHEYIPQNNGTVLVKNPEAWFYTPNRQQLHIIGTDGQVVMRNPPELSTNNAAKDNAPPAPPDRGRINHVTIELLDPNPKNNLVLTTNNVQFDNETLLITTESFADESGTIVPADQVPVHVEGNYKFDGRGLTMRWNDKDGRLEMLEIAHGQMLEIDDTSGISGLSATPGAARAPAAQPSAALPVMLASNDDSEDGEAIQAAARSSARKSSPRTRPAKAGKTRSPAVPTPYLATFNENVTITQGDLALVTAERMEVQFETKQDSPRPATQPAEEQKKQGKEPGARSQEPGGGSGFGVQGSGKEQEPEASLRRAQSSRSQKPEGSSVGSALADAEPLDPDANAPQASPLNPQHSAPSTQHSSQSSTQPSTQHSSQPPVIIRWTGKLTIIPTPAKKRMVIAPGSAIVSLFGKPVTILRNNPAQQERDDIRSAVTIYHTSDRSASLYNSPEVPQVILKKFTAGRAEPTSTITTDSIDYVAADHLATLGGAGHVVVPADQAAPQKGNLDVNWERGAKVLLADTGRGQDDLAVRQMDLSGNVDVQHPQLALRSQNLSLFFEPSSGVKAPTVRSQEPEESAVGSALADAKPLDHPETSAKADPTDTNQHSAFSIQQSGPSQSSPLHSAPSTQHSSRQRPQFELRRVLATTGVWCRLTDSAGKKQTVEGDRLELLANRSNTGQFEPRQVNADGSVHAFDDQQDLRAAHVALTLKPADRTDAVKSAKKKTATTQPSGPGIESAAVELERMFASGQVVVTRTDGSVANGDELEITTENNEPHVRLAGAPFARVIDAKKTVITGPLIRFDPKRQTGHIIGAGGLDYLPEDPGAKPAKVSWQDHADFDGMANAIDAFGKISFTTIDKDGSVVVGTGQRVHVDLQNKPTATTRPARKGAQNGPMTATSPSDSVVATTRPTTRKSPPSMADAMKMDAMGAKDLKAVTLDGAARVTSTLTDATGKILRRMALEGPTLIYTVAGTSDQPAHTLRVPAAGRMLVSDHMPPEKASPKDKGSGIEGGRGDTAFSWQKDLLYSEDQHRAVMTGQVRIVYAGEGQKKEDWVYVDADQVTADFEPEQKPATKPATKPTTRPASPFGAASGSMHLKALLAQGHVRVRRGGSELQSQRIEFDPESHWITARGTASEPAVFNGPDTTQSAVAQTIRWNSQSWQIQTQNATVQGRVK